MLPDNLEIAILGVKSRQISLLKISFYRIGESKHYNTEIYVR